MTSVSEALDFLQTLEKKQEGSKPGQLPLKLVKEICKIYKVKIPEQILVQNYNGEDLVDYK